MVEIIRDDGSIWVLDHHCYECYEDLRNCTCKKFKQLTEEEE